MGERSRYNVGPAALTPSQLVVLRLRAEGLNNGEVAKRLDVSEQTVKNHAAEGYKRLGVPGIVAAMNLLGWVNIPEVLT